MIKTEIILIAILVLLCACGNREKYDRLLAEADSLNQNYIPFTTDSTMLDVVDYYDHHGTANERMKAHYLLGCVYRDLGEAPQALECYHDAVDCADTTAQDCDYKLLSRVYGQMAYLFDLSFVPNDEIESAEKAYHYAMLAKDTISALIFLNDKANAYEKLNQLDSVETIATYIFHRFKKLGTKEHAARTLNILIYTTLCNQKYEQARNYMDYYEKNSGFYDKGEVVAGKQIYYYFKGLYYLGTEQPDSAEFFFRKLLQTGQGYNEIHAAYDGLFKVYADKNMHDSLSKYAVLSTNYNDSLHMEMHTDNLQQVQAAYDYSHQKEIADKAKLNEEKAEKRNVTLLLIIVVLSCLSYLVIQRIKKTKDRKYQTMKVQLESDIELLEETKAELEILLKTNTDEFTHEIQEKESKITELKSRIKETAERKHHIDKTVLDSRLLSSRIYSKFRAYADKPLKRPTMKDWSDLRNMMNREYPSFYTFLVVRHDVSIADFDIYILYRLHFRLTDIANLTGLNASTINTKRKRLFKSIYQREGTTDEIVSFIMEIE